MNLLLVFLILFAVRLASVFVVKTFYVPDEYWQCLEVAHKLTFGYGYLTWEWVQGIRSYMYPLAIAGIYKFLDLLNLDSAQFLIILPRILQATLSAYSDYRFFLWTGKKKWALFLIITSWFWFYIGSRTLSNTLETALTTIALSYFPWYGESFTYLWPAALCCFIRPTAALIWLPLVIYHLRKSNFSWIKTAFQRILIIGLFLAAICIGLDSWMHGKILVTPYEFLKYNIFNNIGSFYGSHSWYWYFAVGLPTILNINIVPFILGIKETITHREVYPVRKYLLITIIFSLCALSTIEHKEFRFISILLPICLYITADYLTRFSYKASKFSLWLIAGIILLGNAFPAWYLSTYYQKGPLEVMDKLRDIVKEYRNEKDHSATIFFLMPCHSTPYYSHIHWNVTMRFLTCEPNLNQQNDYKDEAEQFFNSPEQWLRGHIPSYPRTAKPSHVVMYEPLAQQINEFLIDYKELYKIKNAAVSDSFDLTLVEKKLFDLVKENPLNIGSLFEYIQSTLSKNILIFQRLRTGENNVYNRDDFQNADGKLKLPKLAKFNEDIIYGQDEFANEANIFN